MMTNDSNALKDNEWRDLVGGFILSFGDIELITYQLWREFFPGEKLPDNFTPRTVRVVEHLKIAESENEIIIRLLSESLDLAKIRNVIAHNPLQVEIYKHTRTGQHFFDQGIFCKKSDKYISEQRLKELCEEVECLSMNLHMALGHV